VDACAAPHEASMNGSKPGPDSRRDDKLASAINRILSVALHCETLEELARESLAVCEEVTGSAFGWIGEINGQGHLDTIALSNPGWEACRIPESHAALLVKDMPLRGVWAEVIHSGRPLFTNDPASHPASVGIPPDHPPLNAFLGSPMLEQGKVVGMISVGNRAGGYRDRQREQLETLTPVVLECLRRKRAERALQLAHEELELRVERRTRQLAREKAFSDALIDSLPGVFYSFGTELRFQRWNKGFEEVSGYSGEEFGALSPLDLFEPEDGVRVAERIGEVFTSGSAQVDAPLRTKDGRTIPHHFTGRLLVQDDEAVLVGMGVDISLRAEAEREREKLLQQMGERIKELRCLHGVANAARDITHIPALMRAVTALIPQGWQHPEITAARIVFDGWPFFSSPFAHSVAQMSADILVKDTIRGRIEVHRLEEPPEAEGPLFLDEERELLDSVAVSLGQAVARREAEKQALALFDGIEGVIYVADPHSYELLWVNDEFRRTWGDDALGRPCYRVLQGRESPCPFCTNDIIMGEKLGGCHTWEYQNEVSGRWYRCSDKAIRWSDGRLVRFELAVDISREVQAKAALARSELLHRSTFEQSAVGVAHLSPMGDFLSCNLRFGDLMGQPPEALVGASLADPTHPDDRRACRSTMAAIREGRLDHYQGDRRYLRPDGTVIWGQLTLSPIRDEQGSILLIVAVVQDVTLRKLSELEQRRLGEELARKNSELEQLLYVTSHDLRSPLVNVQGFSQELRASLEELQELLEDPEIPDRIRAEARGGIQADIQESLDFISNGVSRMDRLLSGLLQISRLERRPMEPRSIDVDALVRSVVGAHSFQLQEATAQVEIGPLPPCVCDPAQLEQAFANLLTNALKHGRGEQALHIELGGERRGEVVQYTVTDNGPGILPDHQDKIFELFHRLSPHTSEGDGLGLAIVQRVAERNGGTIRVESEPGRGARFVLTLPASQNP
jgi:PAS domain S-box-containing protein